MTNLKKQLRERINKNCPHLLELEFGCEVILNIGYKDKIRRFYKDRNKFTLCGNENLYSKSTIDEILGKPPTLSDLMIAINGGDMDIAIYMDGQIYERSKGKLGKIDLTKPPLEQDEDTMELLLELLDK